MSEDARVATITRGLLKSRTADEAALAAAALLDLERELAEWEERWHAIESKVLLHDDAIARAETAEARLAEVTAEREALRDRAMGAEHNEGMVLSDLRAAEAQLAVARRGLATIAADDPPVNSAAYRAGKEGLRQLARSYLAQLDGEQRG